MRDSTNLMICNTAQHSTAKHGDAQNGFHGSTRHASLHRLMMTCTGQLISARLTSAQDSIVSKGELS
jgi:hypothetical protein